MASTVAAAPPAGGSARGDADTGVGWMRLFHCTRGTGGGHGGHGKHGGDEAWRRRTAALAAAGGSSAQHGELCGCACDMLAAGEASCGLARLRCVLGKAARTGVAASRRGWPLRLEGRGHRWCLRYAIAAPSACAVPALLPAHSNRIQCYAGSWRPQAAASRCAAQSAAAAHGHGLGPRTQAGASVSITGARPPTVPAGPLVC